jgi:biopolymer transport protein ExbD
MAVHHPGSRAGHGIALKTIQKTVRTGGSKAIFATLNVVPMIDLFIMLVIFLIQSFSAAGELMLVNPNVAMPKASSKAELERAPMVALTRGDGSTLGEMLFENKRIMSLGDVNEVKYPSWDIKPLAEVLKTSWKFQQNPRNPQKVRESRKVIIQSDRTVPFQVIKMVMATCGRNEYREPNFAIMVDGRGDEGLAPSAAP